MAMCVKLQASSVLRKGLTLIGTKQNVIRNIATSEKKSDCKEQASGAKEEQWEYYGFNTKNKFKDRFGMHVSYFWGFSVIVIGGGTVFCYMPDLGKQDWAQREAYLELRRREQLGLPLIDENLIDPAKVHLPSDEELGDMEIYL